MFMINVEKVQGLATRMVKVVHSPGYEERLRKLDYSISNALPNDKPHVIKLFQRSFT